VIGWVDASAGASGDMLLGALVGAGVPPDVLRSAVDAATPEPVQLELETVTRAGLSAVRCRVVGTDSRVRRTWTEVRHVLEESSLEPAVRMAALTVFERLAAAESAVHGVAPEEVHFHEVGALDAVADVVGVCAGMTALGLDRLVVSPVGVGAGRVASAHGSLPVPVPAVVQLLRGVPSLAGPATTEACTPTGAALLATLADAAGPQPAMTVTSVGVGAGGRDPATHANVLRLLLGEQAAPPGGGDSPWLIETNIDDLDPRLLPDVVSSLLALGALDAWLTPVLMKKGRPGHILSALVTDDALDGARDLIFAETTTLGVRVQRLSRSVCDRSYRTVEVAGQPVTVKVATWHGREVNLQPEFESVKQAARILKWPAGTVLAEAVAAARQRPHLPGTGSATIATPLSDSQGDP
jgi:uncharacterized protein (TIGR00299 family) protein